MNIVSVNDFWFSAESFLVYDGKGCRVEGVKTDHLGLHANQ